MMKILFISLGCDKNLVDSEVMLGLLAEKGYGFTDDETQADIIVVNTCCFIGDAKEESVNTILEMAEWKNKGKLKGLIVTGCLAERYREEILKEIPEVDAVVGTASYDRIAEVIEQAAAGEQKLLYGNTDRLVMTETGRILTTGGHYAHLKIAEGCDKHCTYCIIPKLRGRYRSFPMEKLVKEAQELADKLTGLFGISHIVNKYPAEISGGEKQRAAVARSLINNPLIILADEPTGNLDSKSSRAVIESFGEARERMGATIFMVTHDSFAASFCDRVVLLKDGSIYRQLENSGERGSFHDKLLAAIKEMAE